MRFRTQVALLFLILLILGFLVSKQVEETRHADVGGRRFRILLVAVLLLMLLFSVDGVNVAGRFERRPLTSHHLCHLTFELKIQIDIII